MSKPVKVVLDGTLFAECEMQGKNRDGMMRLAEEVTSKLVLNDALDISFANTVYIKEYDAALKRFITEHYPANADKIFAKKPPFFSDLLKYKKLFRTFLSKVPLSPYYSKINEMDVFHSFYYPFPKPVQKNKIKRSITFLDIIPLRMHGYPSHLIDRTKQVVESIRPNHAISISEFSKQDLLDYDKSIDASQVSVVPLAASRELFYPEKSAEKWKDVKKKYDLPDNYFLCVAGSDIRKNIPHVIKSFSKYVLQEKPADIHLLLTGNAAHNPSLLKQLNIPAEVRSKIYTPQTFIATEDLAAIYSNAICFFFMSKYEGFGLPALEAMQCGTPTVTSDATSLPEVVGDGGIMLPTLDEDMLCDVMSKMYSDAELRKKYSAAGIKRAGEFSWQRCADEYAEIFKSL